MASWHVVVYDNTKRTNNIVFEKECLRVQEANKLIKEKKEEYPVPQFMVTKEEY